VPLNICVHDSWLHRQCEHGSVHELVRELLGIKDYREFALAVCNQWFINAAALKMKVIEVNTAANVTPRCEIQDASRYPLQD